MQMFSLFIYLILIAIARVCVWPKLYWALLFIPLFIAGIVGRILSPIAVCFVKRELYTTTVKRLDKRLVTLERDRLVWWLSWFDTDDNATDEYWYGVYDNTANVPQEYYDTHSIYRWYCRMMWLQRNSMYTFNRRVFGLRPDSKMAWQYKKDVPLLFGYYNSVNIGWKSHKSISTLLYAGRIIGLRKA